MTLVCEHHEELEIDLHQQGFDLLDVWRGRLSFRRLDLLIRHLPPSSLTVRAINPDVAEIAEWSVGDYLAAVQIDLFGQAHFKNWKPIPRPYEAVKQRRQTEARRAALERQAARVRARTT